MAAEKIDRLGVPAGGTISLVPDLKIPLSYSQAKKSIEALAIDFRQSQAEGGGVELHLAWGTHRLRGLLKVEIDDKPPAEIPKFMPPRPEFEVKTASGLVYEQLRAGVGAFPTASSKITAHYTGWLPDGTLFDTSYKRGKPLTLSLPQVIKGWQEGLRLMQVGATYRLTIPPHLAYGKRGQGKVVPPNATLVFLVTLLKIDD